MKKDPMIIKSFKYRLYPTQVQQRELEQTVETCRRWYNLCLADRWMKCDCGLSLDRKVNIAQNVLKRAGHAVGAKAQPLGSRQVP